MVEDTIAISVIRDAKNEDRDAMSEMVHSFQPVLYYVAACHIRTPERIKEAVRRSLSALFPLLKDTENLSSFEEQAMAMVVRICLNEALKEDTSQQLFSAVGSDRKESEAVYTAADETAEGEAQFSEKAAMNLVVNMLKTLPDQERIIFVMHYLDGLSFARISEMVHLPEDLLQRRAQSAKQHLSSAVSHPIPYIFSIIALAEKNKHLILEDNDSLQEESSITIPQEPESAVPSKTAPRLKPILGLSAAAVAGVLLFLGTRKPIEPFSLRSAINVSFVGVDGFGSASLSFTDVEDEALNRILSEGTCTLNDSTGTPSVNGSLSNGEKISYACVFDEASLKKEHYALIDTDIDLVVEGLKEPEPIDLFESTYLQSYVDEESGGVVLYPASDDPMYAEVGYYIVSEDENEILAYANISDEKLLSYGYIAQSHYHTFSYDDIPYDARSLYRQQIIARALSESADYRDEYGYEIANGSDPEINALAQSFIGRGGACNEVANAFIYSLYGVSVHTGYSLDHLFEVDTPEPGDLIYYYDSYGNYRHVATYIGNGLVLNGNYGDGTTHITSMYESWYAQNPMVYLRVER
ncbi:MAG: sigma-70 family RNA polymerase sigma factor [Solobacterium sp.]|nr:sigma-70 family RNA polymerase sigma factor [Solobacterium sp.]